MAAELRPAARSGTPRRATRNNGARARHFTAAHEAASLKTKGVAPPRQLRSKATLQALFHAGMRMCEAKEFKSVTIAELARAADISVGTFYGRFKNKEVFFAALQEITAESIEASVQHAAAATDFAARGDTEAISALVGAWLAQVRNYRGLIKASLNRGLSAQPGAWSPLRRAGRRVSDIFVAALGPRLVRRGQRAPEHDIRIAMQFVFGLVVNTIVNDPGPLSLNENAMQANIEKFVSRFLGLQCGIQGGTQGRAATGRRKTQ